MSISAKVHPVILCGGSGTRLWPLSRQSYPKQFAPLLGPESLFEATVARFNAPLFETPRVLTTDPFRFIVRSLTERAGHGDCPVLIEPEARNTAPAALAAALHLADTDPDALMILAPSDHLIPDPEAFAAGVAAAIPAARAGQIITFGIRPSRAETGFGYLALGPLAQTAVQPLAGFTEKPDRATAEAFVTGGAHLWNAGIFLSTAQTLIEAYGTHAPGYLEPITRAVAKATPDLGFLRLATAPWGNVPTQSIDYAVMEKAQNISVLPFEAAWSDLGGWDAIWQEMARDERGVATGGNATAIDCDDSLLRSESPSVELVGIGLKDTIAIAMSDAVLVADRSRAQDVREAVAKLKAKSAPQAVQLPRDYRPWGWFESLALGEGFQVKRIVVTPGAKLSLQSHEHRSEHWIVVSGTARVTVDATERDIEQNQSIFVPLGARHRLENPGDDPVVLIEVQTGSYLGEDDIVRYDDVYARS